MKIVAISGWKGSGKDTAAKILVDKFGFKRVSFADALKDIVAEQYGLSRASLDDQSVKEVPILGLPVAPKDDFSKMIAEFMVREFRFRNGNKAVGFEYKEIDGVDTFLGVNAMGKKDVVYHTRRSLCILEGSSKRSVYPDYWVDLVIKKAREEGLEKLVIADIRYKNEIAALKIAANTQDDLFTVRINRFSQIDTVDPSERDLDDAEFDFYIANIGTLDQFLYNVNLTGKAIEMNIDNKIKSNKGIM
jgi:hypothetical protein